MTDKINIPTIKGQIGERLARARRRDRSELEFGESPGSVTLSSPADRSVVALACLVLDHLAEHGGTRVPQRPIEGVLRRALATLGPKEVMDLEIEAYELMLWIGSAIDPDWTTQDEVDPATIDPRTGHSTLVQWAIATGKDLQLEYYSRKRGELTSRKITPLSIEAETYIHAFCHLRRDERVFRVSRIATLEPVGGWVQAKPPSKKKEQPVDDGQMDLL